MPARYHATRLAANLVFAIGAVASLVGCDRSDPTNDATLHAAGGYMLRPVANQRVTAAYVTLGNTGGVSARLLTVTTPVAERAELHTTEHADGMVRMRKLAHLDVPAHAALELAPGGAHLMLIDVAPLTGNAYPFEFEFADGTVLTIEFEVRERFAE